MIFAGVDKTGSRVFGTHPSGTYRGYKARTEGAGRETVFNILKDEYKEGMSFQETTKLAIKCLAKALEARQLPLRIKVCTVPADTKKMGFLTDERTEAILKELGVGK
jgi:20S proteasome alpha/beta subunit